MAKSRSRRNPEQLTTPEMLRTPQFYLLYVAFVTVAIGGLMLTAQASPLAKIWKISPAALTLALTLNPLANATSRIGWGWISDRVGREIAMAVAFMLQSVCLIGVISLGSASSTLFVITVVLSFLTWGEVFSLFPSTSGDYFGSKFATSNYGVLYSAKGVAAVIAGFAAVAYAHFHTWNIVFYTSAGLSFVAACVALFLYARPLPRRKASAAQQVLETANV